MNSETITITAPPGTVVFDHTQPLIAALAPLKPPREWFDIPEPDGVTPMNYESNGQVWGHLAPWDTCHAGLSAGAFSECVTAPRSASDYSRFHLGEIETAEGDRISVGNIVLATDHASVRADISSATKHYSDTGSVGAFVRARNGKHGVWSSGVVRSDLSPEQLRDLRASSVSGDWRTWNGTLELCAALAVPVPGFPIVRSQLALSASGEITTLILTEIDAEEMGRKEYLRRRRSLSAAVLTTEKRKALSKSSFAIPEQRAYPIHDRAHAANALARAAGKPEEGRVRAAVCKRYPDMPACKR
jgi:hypothetical protein